MSICGSAAADKSPCNQSTRAVPDLPKDYPKPGRYQPRSIWSAVTGRPIPRSTFADWEASGRIPPPDKVIGRTKYWSEERVHKIMASGKSRNIIAFLEDGTACVVLFPYAPELTASEKAEIDAATRIRFFIYGCPDAPVPIGKSGIGKPDDYPVDSLRFALESSTYASPETLQLSNPTRTRDTLVRSLMDLDAKSGNDDHRSTVTLVTEHRFAGDNVVLCRAQAVAEQAT